MIFRFTNMNYVYMQSWMITHELRTGKHGDRWEEEEGASRDPILDDVATLGTEEVATTRRSPGGFWRWG
jgi:hypothetical protein